jgi:hypothetical protein
VPRIYALGEDHVLISINARRQTLLLLLALAATAAHAGAQVLPEGPIRAFDGRVVVGAEIVATAGSPDAEAWFNYTDYEHNALRMMRFGLSGSWRAAQWLAFVGEVRSEDFEQPAAYAAYMRVRPWRRYAFDIQAGRIPPSFGAFGRRAYGIDNPVIGYPLAYQYLTSLRPDAVPATADDVLSMRARGWRSSFPIGSTRERPGVPLISAFQWDTGVQVRWKHGPVEMTGAVTNGTLSNPLVSDDNGGKQLSARVALTPAIGWIVGVSGARGAWLAREIPSQTTAPPQRVLGTDMEYSRGHWIVRGEVVWSRWSFPVPLAPANVGSVGALATWVEGRYRITPRVFLAGRADRLNFTRLRGSVPGSTALPWDAPVTRIEAGGGLYLQRNFVLRATTQANWRTAGRVHDRTFVSAQLAYWF